MSRFIELFNTHFSLALSKAVKSSRLTTQLATESFCTYTQLLETIKQSKLERQESSLLQNKEMVHSTCIKTDTFGARLTLTLTINLYTLTRFACGNGWSGRGEMERVSSWQAVSVINAWARDRSDEDNAVKDSLSRSLSFHPTVSLNSWSAEQKRITYAGLMRTHTALTR